MRVLQGRRNLPSGWSVVSWLSVILVVSPAYAQLQITPVSSGNFTVQQLVQRLGGPGVIIFNITSNCDPGAIGWFVDPTGTLTIDSGLIMTSGSAALAAGPNSTGSAGQSLGLPGDPDLNTLAWPNPTYDACVVTFQVVPLGDTLSFYYVFGSEEYPEWVFSSYNDVFGFFVWGPGIPPGSNVALIPGSNVPVSINNVNMGQYSCPGPPSGCTNCIYYRDNCNGNIAGEYDGYTTRLPVRFPVVPCDTYTIKLAISDAGDGVYDSGVMIEAGSVTSTLIEVSFSTSVTSNNGFDTLHYLYEDNCYDAYLIFHLATNFNNTLCFTFSYGGNATPNVDFTLSTDTVCFLPGDTIDSVAIQVVADFMPEGVESLIVYVHPPCGTNLVMDTITMYIHDQLDIQVQGDTICPFTETATLTTEGAISYQWTPASLVTCDTCSSTSLIPNSPPDTTYILTVTGHVGACTDTDTVVVRIHPYYDFGLQDTAICLGDTFVVNHPLDDELSSVLWSPNQSLSCIDCLYPEMWPDTTTTYTVWALDTNGCISRDTFTLRVAPPPRIQALPLDTVICLGDTALVRVTASNVWNLSVQPPTGIVWQTLDAVALSPPDTTTYMIVAEGDPVCPNDTVVATIRVDQGPIILLHPYPDTIIVFGTEGYIEALTPDGIVWGWYPGDLVEDSTALGTYALPETTQYVYFWARTANGCFRLDSILLMVIYPERCPDAQVMVPLAFSPNGDGLNEKLYIYTFGSKVEVLEWKIYTRWGEEVFSWKGTIPLGAPHSPVGWDGTHRTSGEVLRPDVYVYYIRYRCPETREVFTIRGDVTLLR